MSRTKKRGVVSKALFKHVLLNNLFLFLATVITGIVFSSGGPTGLTFETPFSVVISLIVMQGIYVFYLYKKAPKLGNYNSALGYTVSSFAILLFFEVAVGSILIGSLAFFLVPTIILIVISAKLLVDRKRAPQKI